MIEEEIIKKKKEVGRKRWKKDEVTKNGGEEQMELQMRRER